MHPRVGSHQHDREPTKCRHGVRHRQVAVNCPGRLIALTLAVHRWPGSGTSRRPPRRFSGAESTGGADDPAVSDALPRRCCAFFSNCSHGSDVSGGRLQLVSAGTERRVRGPCAPPTFRRGAPTVSGRLSVSSAGVKARPRSTATSSVVGWTVGFSGRRASRRRDRPSAGVPAPRRAPACGSTARGRPA